VVRIPHISNFTDFDPLSAVDGLSVHFLERVQDLSPFAAVVLPGSKNTRHDLQWLHDRGWTPALRDFRADGGHLLGICGGYQMMGRRVEDPGGLEGAPGATPGLDLLPVETVLMAPKTTTRTVFDWNGDRGEGYEIHMGRTRRLSGEPLLQVLARNGKAADDTDGCIASDGRVLGTYVHGLFDSPEATRRWLAGVGLEGLSASLRHGPAARDEAYDRLARHLAHHLDVPAVMASAGIPWKDRG
jgi:adenosylcobyric acid synthase